MHHEFCCAAMQADRYGRKRPNCGSGEILARKVNVHLRREHVKLWRIAKLTTHTVIPFAQT